MASESVGPGPGKSTECYSFAIQNSQFADIVNRPIRDTQCLLEGRVCKKNKSVKSVWMVRKNYSQNPSSTPFIFISAEICMEHFSQGALPGNGRPVNHTINPFLFISFSLCMLGNVCGEDSKSNCSTTTKLEPF